MADKSLDDMTEGELAQFYEQHRGDVSLWQKKPVKIRVRRGGPSTVVSVRFASEELAELQRAAGAEDQTISELIRGAALAEARRRKRKARAASATR